MSVTGWKLPCAKSMSENATKTRESVEKENIPIRDLTLEIGSDALAESIM